MAHQSLIHKMKIATVGNRLISGSSLVLRQLCTATAAAEEKNRDKIHKFSLYKQLSAVKWSDKVPDVLQRLTEERIFKFDLIDCVKMFRRNHRYRHCLKILEWMEKGTMKYDERDYALRLGIICKVKGIDEAKKYFDSLPPDMKNVSTYGALLNCYCTESMTDEALALFEKMEEMNCASNVLAFSSIMGLYSKVGQPEKVPPLVQEMKKRNLPLSNFNYCTWMQSYASLADLEGLERVVDEVEQQTGAKDDWTIYSNLATAYVKLGQSEKAEGALKKWEEVLDNVRKTDREGYLFLINVCSGTGNLESVTRVWNKLKSKLKFCDNNSYLTMLKALSKLGDLDGLLMCFKEWESSGQKYDGRLPHVVMDAYLNKDMVEEAELLLKDATEAGKEIWNAQLSFANYYLRKRQIDSAMKHMELGIVDSKGKPLREVIHRFFEYYIEERDVDGAEEFCRILMKAKPLDSEIYLQLLQTYEAAEKTAPEMRQRMEKDGVAIGTEHEELLEKVCPN